MLLQPEMGITMITFFIVLGIYFVMGLSLKVIFRRIRLHRAGHSRSSEDQLPAISLE